MLRLLLPVAVAWGASTSAYAADLAPLAGPPRVADGGPTTVVLHCGVCTPESEARVRTKDAEVLATTSLQGLLQVELRPPTLSAATDVSLAVRVSGDAGKANAVVDLPFVPGGLQPIGVTADRAAVEPGSAPVTLTWSAPPGPRDPAAARYRVAANIGALGPVTVNEDGSATADWTPPVQARAPRLAVVGVVDAADPGQRLGWATVGVRAETALSYDVPPDAEVVLVVGGERFGPQRASPSGSIAFTIGLLPGIATGTLEITAKTGEREDRAVELPLGQGATHLVLPTSEALPADPRVPAPLRVVALNRDGSPSDTAPEISVSRGSLGATTAAAPGVFGAEWTAPAQTGTVELTASVGARKSEGQARLVEGLPVVALTLDPDALAHDARSATLMAVVAPPDGGLVVSKTPRFEAVGASAASRVKGGNGAWTLPLKVPTTESGAAVQVLGSAPGSDGPVAHLVAWSEPPRAPGLPATLTVVAQDAAGLPVPGVAVSAAVPVGSGSLPPTATTGPSGEVRWTYDLADDIGPSTLRFEAGGAQTGLALLPGNLPAPRLGTKADRARLDRWRAALPTALLPRAAAPVAVAVAPVAVPSPEVPAPTPPAAAPETADPGPTAVTGDPAPAATPPPKPARPAGSFSRPWARIGLDLGGAGFALTEDAQLGGVGPTGLEDESGNLLSGEFFTGYTAQVRGVLFPGDGRLGVDASVGFLSLPADLAGADDRFSDLVFQAGGRLRSSTDKALSWHIVAQGERAPAFLYLFPDGDASQLEAVTFSYYGLRGGAGLTLQNERWWGELQVSETFAFAPVDTRVTLAGEHAFTDRWAVRLQGRYDLRSLAFEVAEEDVAVRDQLQMLMLGTTARF